MNRTGRDFPFYDDKPVAIGWTGWLVLHGALLVAFLALTQFPEVDFPFTFIPALLFLSIPLMTLRVVVGPASCALFRPVRFKDLGLMLAFGLATLVGSMVVAFVLSLVGSLAPNPRVDLMSSMSGYALAAALAPTLPQLIGEEMLGIVTFLAVLWLCFSKWHLARSTSIAIALGVSALIFGAAHLPTYDWHWAQALIGIGSARVILTLAYITTKNLWVSAGAHIVNDWTGFLISFSLGHAPIGVGD
ncbi:MAG: lysostaphin resistance A-like protein [Aliihoeflea sp.]|uniref:lysostaphin resistance A-like protein n=1 Tax=Aliihoeflea sp. TaxID=2608088 RepID=UPI0040333040